MHDEKTHYIQNLKNLNIMCQSVDKVQYSFLFFKIAV